MKQVINERSSNNGIHVTVKQPYYMVGIYFPQQHALSMVTFKSRGIDCFPPKVPENRRAFCMRMRESAERQ